MGAHEDLSRRVERKQLSERAFGLVFGALFLLAGLWPLHAARRPRLWLLGLSAAFFLAALVRPPVLRSLNQAWNWWARCASRITNPILTGLLFYFCFVPIGWVVRMLGKDLLHLKFDPAARTYWIERPAGDRAPETMSKQF